MFLVYATVVNVTAFSMFKTGTRSASAFAAVASLILYIVNASATVQTARSSQALAIDGTRLFFHDFNIITTADI